MKFVIETKKLDKIKTVYTKKSYGTEAKQKAYMANDFIVEVDGLNVTFIEVDPSVFCYSKIRVKPTEELKKLHGKEFEDGTMSFNNMEMFDKLVKITKTANYVKFDYDIKELTQAQIIDYTPQYVGAVSNDRNYSSNVQDDGIQIEIIK